MKKAVTSRQYATTSRLKQRQVRKQGVGGEIRSSGHVPIVASVQSRGTQSLFVEQGVEAWKLPTLVDRVVPRFHPLTIMTTLDVLVPCTCHAPCTMYRGSYAVAEPDKPWIVRGPGPASSIGSSWQDSCAQVLLAWLVDWLARRIVARQLRDLVRRIIWLCADLSISPSVALRSLVRFDE